MAPTMQNTNAQIAFVSLPDGTASFGCSREWGLREYLQNDNLHEEIIGS